MYRNIQLIHKQSIYWLTPNPHVFNHPDWDTPVGKLFTEIVSEQQFPTDNFRYTILLSFLKGRYSSPRCFELLEQIPDTCAKQIKKKKKR